jgi:amino acid transporter
MLPLFLGFSHVLLDKFMLLYQGNPDLYHTIISSAKAANFDPNPPFNLAGTFGIFPTAYIGTVWGYWSVCQQSEVKRASDLKNQLIGMLGATAAACTILALIGFTFVNTLGYEFWNALGYQLVNGTDIAKTFPALPDYFLLGALVSSVVPIVMTIILVGAIFNFIQILFNCQIPFPRFLMQYSFDRISPSKLADVSERWHSPVLGYTLNLIITTVWLILIIFTPLGGQLFSVMSISCVLLAADMLAAILLPYRKSIRGIWETSPANKYKIAGIPAIVVFGVLGFLFNAWMLWYYVFFPTIYWAASPAMVTLGMAQIIFMIILYFIIRAYRKRQGIDIDIAFKAIPPE